MLQSIEVWTLHAFEPLCKSTHIVVGDDSDQKRRRSTYDRSVGSAQVGWRTPSTRPDIRTTSGFVVHVCEPPRILLRVLTISRRVFVYGLFFAKRRPNVCCCRLCRVRLQSDAEKSQSQVSMEHQEAAGVDSSAISPNTPAMSFRWKSNTFAASWMISLCHPHPCRSPAHRWISVLRRHEMKCCRCTSESPRLLDNATS